MLRGFMLPAEVESVMALLRMSNFSSLQPENPVETPVHTLADDGVWDLEDPIAVELRPFVEGRLIPYMQEELGCPSLTTTTVFVRHYALDKRRHHSVHMDDALGSAVMDLTPVQGSGLFMGARADAASQFYVPFESPGDVAVHGWDVAHGVRLLASHVRYSIVVWAEPLADIEAGTTTWYHEAAFDGEPQAAYRVGMDAEAEGELEVAKHFYEVATEEGQVFAMHRLGEMLAGEGKRANSLEWLTKAASEGSAAAAVDLGDALQLQGSFEEALSYFKAAALQGDCRAMHRIGTACLNGLGVSADQAEASKYFEAAAASGWSEEQLSRSLWC